MGSLPDSYYTTYDVTILEEGICKVMLNRYWLCIDGDPTKALFFLGTSKAKHKVGAVAGSPQCNQDKRTLETLSKPTNSSIVFIPQAFVPINVYDYVY